MKQKQNIKQMESAALNIKKLSDAQIEAWLMRLPVTLSTKQIDRVLQDSLGYNYIVWRRNYRFFYFG